MENKDLTQPTQPLNNEPAPKRTLDLSTPEDSQTLKEFFMAQADFRVLFIHGRYFIQYKTLKLVNDTVDDINQTVFYEKLVDDYFKGNDNGFDTLLAAQEALVAYVNAGKQAKLYPINLTATN